MSRSVSDEAEQRWPKAEDDTLPDRVAIGLGRVAFRQGAEWAVEETPERIEAVARGIGIVIDGNSDHWDSYEPDARAALAALRAEVQS